MAKFKVGDRVKIIHPRSEHFGREATIWMIAVGPLTNRIDGVFIESALFHRIDIDGLGKNRADGSFYSFPAELLAPLTPPAIDTWASEQVKRVTKPQPILTLPKVPHE